MDSVVVVVSSVVVVTASVVVVMDSVVVVVSSVVVVASVVVVVGSVVVVVVVSVVVVVVVVVVLVAASVVVVVSAPVVVVSVPAVVVVSPHGAPSNPNPSSPPQGSGVVVVVMPRKAMICSVTMFLTRSRIMLMAMEVTTAPTLSSASIFLNSTVSPLRTTSTLWSARLFASPHPTSKNPKIIGARNILKCYRECSFSTFIFCIIQEHVLLES